MERKEFYKRVKEEIPTLLTEYDIENIDIHLIEKNNGTSYYGMTIRTKGMNIAPTINLDHYYENMMKSGSYFNKTLKDIAVTYKEHMPTEEFDVNTITYFERAKDNIIYQLVNFERNQARLKNMPHRKVEDLALIYKVDLADPSESGTATVTISNTMLDMYGIDEETLYQTAKENTKRLYPAYFEDMRFVLFQHMHDDITHLLEVDEEAARQLIQDTYGGDIPMYILTNAQKINGAVTILDPDVMDMVAEKLGKKFFVIPSSVHEVLIVPFSGRYNDYMNYEEMVNEVNATQLRPDEILSEKMYLVDAEHHLFLSADRAQEVIMKMDKEERLQKEKNEEKIPAAKEQPEYGPKL